MPGKINFVCRSEHDGEDCGRDGPTITLVEKLWAYCPRAGYQNHDWRSLGDGVPLAELSVRVLSGKALTD